jgi:ParB-like chromosome segregation protein Spo0J
MNWHIEKRALSSLIEWQDNPRLLTKKGIADLKKSIEKFGCAEPLVINTDGTIIGGHGRKKVLGSLGIADVDCYLPDRTLTPEEVKEVNIRLNKNIAGEWDFDKLANAFEIDDLKEWGFEDKDFGLVDNEVKALKEKKVQIKIYLIRPEDWLLWKNEINNFLNEKEIPYELKE